MKFIVTTGTNYANDPIRITGMHNKVTVDFAKPNASENGFSYSVNTTDGGLIKMPAKDASNITWAIVLPQDALAEGATGSAYTNGYKGNRPAISKIERNHYYAGDGIAMTINTESNIINLSTASENLTVGDGYILTGTLAGNYKISIADGATVLLNGVTINGTNNSSYAWAGLNCNGDATIILKDGTTNNVKGFYEDYPGIHVPEGSTLTIRGESLGTGKLVASSNTDGSLSGAGIGGGWNLACGNIVIQGGDITATGSAGAAGIGSNNKGCGNITISGGTVTANGGYNAAGIGSGNGGNCGDITISGGTVTATGGASSAGIGSGNAGRCSNITITNTVTRVTATKGNDALESIGRGYNCTSIGTVTVGGVVGAITESPYTYPAPKPASEATAEDLGKVIGSNGYIYDDAAAATAAGTTALAMICYVGDDAETSTTYNHGLALALTDANAGNSATWCSQISETCLATQYELDKLTNDMAGIANTTALIAHGTHAHQAASVARSYNSSTHPTGTSDWFLPSAGQWEKMINACKNVLGTNNNYTDLRDGFSTRGGTNLLSDYYWSSTEANNQRAWLYKFGDDYSPGEWGGYDKDNWNHPNIYVRSAIAF